MRSSGGSVLVSGLFFLSALFAFSLVVTGIGRFHVEAERAKSVVDNAVLASLRMKIDALVRIAERSSEIHERMGGVDANGRIIVAGADVPWLSSKTKELTRALSGYQARTQSVLTPVAQGNGRDRDSLDVVAAPAAALNIKAQPLVLVDETSTSYPLSDVWMQRVWRTDTDLNPVESVVHRLAFTAGPWSASVASIGKLRWNKSPGGNGGFPAVFEDAISAARLRAYRTASFRAVLVNAE